MDPFKHVQHEDDVLETALNSGIKFAAQKYGVYETAVERVVKQFKVDIEDQRPCSPDRGEGFWPCGSCKGWTRIKI